MKTSPARGEEIVTTTCASHCGGSCLLKVHVKDGVITRIETDDGPEPQLRGCLRGRAYRQRVYSPGRILYPMKRTGNRGEGEFTRISWDEALDTVARQITRVRDSYGPASILFLAMGGDVVNLNNIGQITKLLGMAGGYTGPWGMTSFQGGVYAQRWTYGTIFTSNTRDDLLNSRLIIMWGWNPASTISGVNTNWYLARARENGTRIVAVDPRFTDSTATFADQWIPIRPSTDGAMLLAMAYVIIEEGLEDRKFLDSCTTGFEAFRDYILGKEDGLPKTPHWAEKITGVQAGVIAELARAYATTRPAALMAGIAPGRSGCGEQYHRIAITLAALTGNVGIHGGDAAGRAWESTGGGFPYQMNAWKYVLAGNPVDQGVPRPLKGSPSGYKSSRIHGTDLADFIIRGKAGGYNADCRLIAAVNCNFVNAFPNLNRVVRALHSDKLDFFFILEQFMTPTARFADIILPTSTFMERNDLVTGVGLAFYGYAHKAVEPLGETKSHFEIASLLASRLGIENFSEFREDELLEKMIEGSEVPDFNEFKSKGIFRLNLDEPYVAFANEVRDPAGHPFPTPSGKIEIFSSTWAALNDPGIPPVPKYVEPPESASDTLRTRYPLQLISSHFRRRANCQFDNIPWLRELEPQAVMINAGDAGARGITNGDPVLVFNDRGKVIIPAKVTERIMPGVVDLPFGAWYYPDEDGIDRGGCVNVLTNDVHTPGGAYTYNTCLVEIEPAGVSGNIPADG